MNTVKRAVIMAAGVGVRMRPLTERIPKPLVPVNGVRMIDSVIDALHQNGITEIYVVVGYRKEQFASLPAQYPGLRLIENPYYDTCNNISSLYVAREHVRDCIILDGDQIVKNPEALSPTFTLSGYNAVWCEGDTDEWLMTVKNGMVTGCSRTGGRGGWQLYSVSRWSKEDGERLAALVAQEFEAGNRKIYWDDVPMFCHFDTFTLGIREMHKGDIMEIDSLEELREIDTSYREE